MKKENQKENKTGGISGIGTNINNPSRINPALDLFLLRFVTETLTEQFGAVAVVTDDAFQIIQVNGNLNEFLDIDDMPFDFNLLKITRSEISDQLKTAGSKALKENRRIAVEDLHQKGRYSVGFTIKPFTVSVRDEKKFFLIVFSRM